MANQLFTVTAADGRTLTIAAASEAKAIDLFLEQLGCPRSQVTAKRVRRVA